MVLLYFCLAGLLPAYAQEPVEDTILECQGIGDGGDRADLRGIRFTVGRSFHSIDVRMDGSAAGLYQFDAELRRSTGFTGPADHIVALSANLSGSPFETPYPVVRLYFDDVAVSTSESFTLKFVPRSSPGTLYIEVFGIGNEPCPDVQVTNENDVDNPTSRTDPPGFRVIAEETPTVSQQDSLGLVAIYNATDGPNWTNSDNWLEEPVESWFGVGLTDGRVTRLDLCTNGLDGVIPSEIGDLTGLNTLELCENQLGGSIPPEIGNLDDLGVLNLSDNRLSGTIPQELGTLFGLTRLLLHNNELDGAVPASLTRLSNLSLLWLYENALEDLPDMSNMEVLDDLQVQDNRLTFEDVEPNVGVATTFVYAPQANVGTAHTESINVGDDLTLAFTVGGADNLYQWYKDGVPISGATDDVYSITSATADDAGIYELEITNRTATQLTLMSEPITVVVRLPDLVVSSLTHAPESPTTEDEITFTAVVENVGAAPAGPSTLAFAVGGEDPGETFAVPSLEPGERFAVERIERLTAAQAYENTATADDDDDVEESDETNNVATDAYAVTLPQRTLTVASRDPSSGVPITVEPADINGDSDGTTEFTRLYADGVEVTLTAPEAAGGTGFVAWRLDGSMLSTNPRVTVTMDGDHTARVVYGSQPDLVVSSLTHEPESPTTEDEVTFTAVVENVGAAPAGPSTLAFAVGGEDPGETFAVPSLAPGERFAVERIERLTAAQAYENTATADVHDDVEESDETNNVATDAYTVSEIAALHLDVTPEGVSSLDWGESTIYTVIVEDEQGDLVSEAMVTVDDGLRNEVVNVGLTDGSGRRSYTATVPAETSDGIYDLVFTATKQGFTGSEPVTRQVGVEHREPGISISSGELDFGDVLVGAEAERSVTVANTGTADLMVAPEITGSGSDAFSIAGGGGPFTLSPSSPTREITVRYAPQDAGQDEAALVLRSNAGDEAVRLLGSGTLPDVIVSNGGAVPADGETHGIQVVVSDNFLPTQRELFFRRGGESEYRTTELVGSGSNFSGSIPSEFVTERGIDFFVRLSDGETTVTFPQDSPDQDPAHLRVRVRRSFVQTTRPRVYRMVSVPLVLDDTGVDGVFGDDYGPGDRTRWRVLRWQPEGSRYEDPSDIGEGLQPGTAVWLITHDGTPFDVEEAVSVDASEPYPVVLEPGWNQIGNPFAFPVAWSSVIGRETVEGPWFYDSTQEDYDACCRPVLEPWEGYFVLNDTGERLTLNIPPVESPSSSQDAATSLPPEAAYAVQLVAELKSRGLRDAHNYLGLATHAAAGRDGLDLREAPGVGDHVRLSIVETGKHMAASYKPIHGTGQQWDVEVAAVSEDGLLPIRNDVRITLREHGSRPDGFGLHVLDLDRARMVDLAQQAFEVTLDERSPRRHLRVFVGTNAFTEDHSDGVPLVPLDFVLEQNYPNPFNPETVIRYQLPARLHAVLEVYDALGRRVRTLVDAVQEPGAHERRWDGLDDARRQVASGVYVGRLRAGGFSDTIHMLLLR